MAVYELYFNRTNHYHWYLKTDEKNIFAYSGQGYVKKEQAVQDVVLIRSSAKEALLADRTDSADPEPEDRIMAMHFEIYQDNQNQYCWRFKTGQGTTISYSAKALLYKRDALREIRMVRHLFSGAHLLDLTGRESPNPEMPVPYDLGNLPSGLTIQWPAPPQIEIYSPIIPPIKISSPIGITSPLISSPLEGRTVIIDQANIRVIISADIDQLTLAASDIDVEVNNNVYIGTLYIQKGLSRFRIRGGTYGRIELAVPADFNQNPAVYNGDWLIQDVMIDSVTVINTTSSGFLLRGKRIAILNSHVQGFHYSVWAGDTTDFQNEDIILANNVFESAGPEATVRLVSVLRSVVVDNRIINVGARSATEEIINKHNYRIHGKSDFNLAARNTLVKSGLMIGTMEGDDLGTVWFQDNFIYHITPSLLEVDDPSHIRHFIATGNNIFSEVWDCFLCRETPADWRFENNYIRRLPPS